MTERYLPAQLRVGSGHALICQRFSGRILPGNWLAHQSRISERMREFSGRIFRILSEILRGDSLATPRLQANALADWSVIRARPRWPPSAEPETLHTAQNHLSACLAASRGLAVGGLRRLALASVIDSVPFASGALFVVQLNWNSPRQKRILPENSEVNRKITNEPLIRPGGTAIG